MHGDTLADVAPQMRLRLAAGRPLGGVRAAMARAALALQVEAAAAGTAPAPGRVTTAGTLAVRPAGPTLRPTRRRSRRYAERHLATR